MHLGLSAAPRFVCADGTEVPLALRDAALLAFLALEGPTARLRLAALLWPDSEPEAARNALRQRLFQLRRQLGVELVTGMATLALAAGVSHDLDESDSVLGDAAHEHSPEFGAWLVQQRARRSTRMRQSLAELCEMAEGVQDWGDALTHAGELLALAPLSEEAHRRVMRLHYLAGDRAAALLAFDRCERFLKDEVGARPSHETLALLATIEAAAPGAGALAGATLPASVLRPPRLIGRERELEALTRAWQSGQVVALIGEAGLGKTRLLQGFAEGRSGVVRAAGRPGDAGVPFATLARLLRGVTALAGAGAERLLPAPTRSEIARVLPEFDSGAGRPAGEGQRLVLQRAVRALLASQATLAGLIVDDLHFADEASLDMLGALIDGGDTEGVPALLWALAYRPAEAGSPVQALHDGLVEQARLLPVALPPLDGAALAALVDSLALPGIQGTALAPGLLRRTGGNPLFVLETLKQAWVERTLGDLADAQALPRPLSVGRLIERRIVQLSPGALALARVAAIAGVDFEIGLAEQVLGVAAMHFADALNELESAQVLRGTAFAHDLVFDAVRASVPAAIAGHTHASVAAWLEQHGGEPARVARHWISAGRAARALPWLERAAQAAGLAVRRKEQIAFLEEKSSIEERSGDAAAAFDTLMQAAEIQVTLDGGLGQGLAGCDRLDALARNASQRVRARTQRANLATMRGEHADAEQVAAAALREALREGVAAEFVAQCRVQLATALSSQERSAEAIVHFEASMGWIDEHGSDMLRCELHGNLATTYDRLGRFDDAVHANEVAWRLAQRVGDHTNTAICLSNLGASRMRAGRLADAEHALMQARLVRAQAAEPSSIDGFIAIEEAVCRNQGGRYAAALQSIDAGLECLRRFAPGYEVVLLAHQATCWAYLGQWARMDAVLKAIGAEQAVPPRTRTRAELLRRQRARALQIDYDPAVLDAAIVQIGDAGAPDFLHAVQIVRAGFDDDARAIATLQAILDAAARLEHRGTSLVAHARCARLAARLGDTGRARLHADAAVRLAGEVTPAYQYPIEPLLDCCVALDTIGDAARALQLCQATRERIEAAAREQVPVPFRDSFLHRNPVNRELLALAARLAG